MGLGVRGGIAADDASGALFQFESGEQRMGEGGRFVGDHPPAHAAGLNCREYIGHTGKQPAFTYQMCSVELEKALAQGFEALIAFEQAKAQADQHAHAVRDVRTDDVAVQRSQLVFAQQIERMGEIRRRIDQGTVEIEQQAVRRRHRSHRPGMRPVRAEPSVWRGGSCRFDGVQQVIDADIARQL